MSAQQHITAAAAPGGSTPTAVEQLVLQAEVHAASVPDALGHYQTALEQLRASITRLAPGSPAQVAHIQRFGELLSLAEALKRQQQANPAAAEYSWRQRQAKHLAEQAVSADTQGAHDSALELYHRLLECLNRCHALETTPAHQAAIMSRFRVYLERAEQLRHSLQPAR